MTFQLPSYDQAFPSVLLFGPPGSGKGTLGRILAQAGSHFHLSSGDIFRGLSPESPTGKLFASYAEKGHLVPDEVTIAILESYIQGLIATNRYFPQKQFLLLDGVPRTLKQAEMMAQFIDVRRVIVLKMDNYDALIKRMKRRAIIEGRKDDTDETILKTRFQVYEKDTKNLLSYYPNTKIFELNADQKPLEVLRDALIGLAEILSP